VSCPENKKLEAFFLGKLSISEKTAFIEHLDNCDECINEFDKIIGESSINIQLKAEYDRKRKSDTTTNSATPHNSPFLTDIINKKMFTDIEQGSYLDDNRFKIIRKLGPKVSRVYHAEDRVQGEIALKIVSVFTDSSGKKERELSGEVKNKDNIYDFTHIIQSKGFHIVEHKGMKLGLLAMEYANGGSLNDWLTRNLNNSKKRTDEGIALFEQACKGVKVLHEANIIHRDIKPDNILICRGIEKDIAKLSDFGISWKQRSSIDSYCNAGTFQYMAPEQFQGGPEEITPACDIYSLGIVLFEILKGRLPFEGRGFEEMRDKHTNQAPPQLTGELSLWGKIVERCLNKLPSERYSNVDALQNDILRLKNEYDLNADIACINCNHINVNVLLPECEECHHPLPESFFHECPTCHHTVRIDQEKCWSCGTVGIPAHYLLEKRKIQIEQLKDEDPAQAIMLLEKVLQEHRGEYADIARKLMIDLSKRKNKIDELATQADELIEMANYEEAIERYGQVLELIPRHRIALEKIRELEDVLGKLKRHDSQADKLMDSSKFVNAEELLLSSMEIAPNRKDIAERLKKCRQRHKKYKKAYELSGQFSEQGLLLQAKREIQKALKQAPFSPEAKSLSETILNTIRETSDLVKKLQSQIEWAQFDNADNTVARIEQIQADNKSLEEIKPKLQRIRKKYISLMADAEVAMTSLDLSKASEKAVSALDVCPNSIEGKALVDLIESQKNKTETMLKSYEDLIVGAQFDQARKALDQAASIWVTAVDFAQKKEHLSNIQTEYDWHYQDAIIAQKKTHLDLAKTEVEAALSLCPQSEKANELLKKIGKAIQKVNKQLGKAESLVKAAEFEKAKDTLDSAKKIWCTFEGLEPYYTKMDSVKKEYSFLIDASGLSKDEGNLAKAKEQLESAILLCPDSKYAQDLLSAVIDDQDKVFGLLSSAQNLTMAAKFNEAREKIKLARALWCSYPDLNQQDQQIAVVEQEYTVHFTKSKKLFDRKKYENALVECDSALKLCKNSEQTIELKDLIQAKLNDILDRRRQRKKLINGICNGIVTGSKEAGSFVGRVAIAIIALVVIIIRVSFEGIFKAFESHGKAIMITIAILGTLTLLIVAGIWFFTTEDGMVTLIAIVLFGSMFASCYVYYDRDK